MENLAINTEESIRQLTELGDFNRQFTFQTFDDSPSKRPELTKQLYGTFEENKNELERLNRLGAGIFVLVNISKSEKTTKDQIIGRVAHFADGDDGPIPNVNLEPTMVIQTANGEHAYWVLDKTEPIDCFERLQKAISTKLNTDSAVSNPNRIMRLAGFYHQKDPANPILVTVSKSNGPKYSLAVIEKHFAVAEKDSPIPSTGAGKWENGHRNNALYKVMKNVEAFLPVGLSEQGMLDFANLLNDTCTVEPLPEGEIVSFTKSRFKEFQNFHAGVVDFELMTLEELDLMNFAPKEAVVENLMFKKQVSIIGAKPKIGKSTLMRYMAACIADGKSFLGRKTFSNKIFYLALEEFIDDVQSDFKDMSIENKSKIRTGGLPGDKDKLQVLEQLLIRHIPDIVFIDTMVHLAGVKDLNDYTQTSLNLKKFRDMAELYNVHICLVHHNRKGDSNGNDSLLGSTGIAGAVDLIMELKKDDDNNRFFKTDGRSSQVHFEETPLHFDFETKSFSINQEFQKNEGEEFLAFIKKNPGLLRNEIQTQMGKRSQSVSNILKSLKENGLVEQREKRYYAKFIAGGSNDLY